MKAMSENKQYRVYNTGINVVCKESDNLEELVGYVQAAPGSRDHLIIQKRWTTL